MPRKLLFSVTIKDCKVDTFTCGGKGGSGKDTSNNGVRIRHEPSGAVGEARDSRDQLRNKRAAFRRMAETVSFRAWTRLEAARLATGKTVDELVEEELVESKLKVERKTPLGWEVWHQPDKVEQFMDEMEENRKAYELKHYGTPEAPVYPHHHFKCDKCSHWPASAEPQHGSRCLKCWHNSLDW